MGSRSLLLALALAGCAQGGTLVVQVRTDLVPGVELGSAEVVAVDPVGAPWSRALFANDALDWGLGVRVAEVGDLAPGAHRFDVRALDPAGMTLLERPVRVTIDGGVRVVTVLLTRDCAGVSCPGDGDPTAVACLGGRCVPEDCAEEDPARCVEPECRVDADCDAPPSACASGQCTVSGTCFTTLDHATCAEGEVCTAGSGCGRPCDAAAPCGAGSVCDVGLCVDACGGGRTDCSGFCADVTSDPINCGTCGMACTADCVRGSCSSTVCTDMVCDASGGESCVTCPEDCGTCPCLTDRTPCSGDAACCSGLCDPTDGCVSCRGLGRGCSTGSECCAGLCSAGSCVVCVDVGADCTTTSECCSGTCNNSGGSPCMGDPVCLCAP